MENKTILYFTSALLWLGVGFSSFYIYQNSEEQYIETIVQSSKKIDDLHQELHTSFMKWWERDKLANLKFISSNGIESIKFIDNSKHIIEKYKCYDKLTFSDIKPYLYTINIPEERMYFSEVDSLISDEKYYINSELTKKMYKNILLQSFRQERENETRRIWNPCTLGYSTKVELKLSDKNKIGVFANDFDNYTVGYFTYSEDAEYGYVKGSKDFEFEMTTKTLGRNPKTITKKYRTLPKEGQDLKAFDYEEVE